MNGISLSSFPVYEHPLNERIRLLLRLESLFTQFSYYSRSEGVWDSWAAVATLINLQNLVELSDIKSEVLRELERQNQNLTELHNSPQVDAIKLSDLINKLSSHVKNLVNTSGRIGHQLRSNDFLATIRQRLTIPGGTCNFDAPAYYFWLNLPAEERKKCLHDWAEPFSALRAAIFLILDLVRNNITVLEKVAHKGFFSTSLEGITSSFQLIQILLPPTERIFPEISGGKHRVSIRFLMLDAGQHASQVNKDVRFILRCCS